MGNERYLIQIRGASGCGKSTAMYGFVKKHNLFEDKKEICAKKITVYKNDTIVVIGRYSGAKSGCDGHIPSTNFFFELVNELMSEQYKYILFEWMFVSGLVKFGLKLNEIAKRNGYQYISVQFEMEYSKQLGRLLERNGRKNINLDYFDKKIRDVYNSQKKMKLNGIRCEKVNLNDCTIEEMDCIIDNIIGDLQNEKTGTSQA